MNENGGTEEKEKNKILITSSKKTPKCGVSSSSFAADSTPHRRTRRRWRGHISFSSFFLRINKRRGENPKTKLAFEGFAKGATELGEEGEGFAPATCSGAGAGESGCVSCAPACLVSGDDRLAWIWVLGSAAASAR